MKLVINVCYGGFSLSSEARKVLAAKKGKELYYYEQYNNEKDKIKFVEVPSNSLIIYTFTKYLGEIAEFPEDEEYKKIRWEHDYLLERDDPDLVATVEELGEEASSGEFAELKVIKIPDDVDWYIFDYDGNETIHEKHRRWK